MNFTAFIQEKNLFLVGIKGTGMTSLAITLKRMGASVTGSDVDEHFSTDTILSQSAIPVCSFLPEELPPDTDIVIHSAAYPRDEHPQLVKAKAKNISIYSYPQWLSFMTEQMPSYGIAGSHGKTTSCGCVEWVLQHSDVPLIALYGSRQQKSISYQELSDNPIGVFESCEYRNHFLQYHLNGLLITTIDHDHPDWFPTEQSVLDSFISLVGQLPQHAPLVCNTDSPLARELIAWVHKNRSDLLLITYGEHPSSMLRLSVYEYTDRELTFTLSPVEGYFYGYLGSIALTLDTVGAALLSTCIVLDYQHDVTKDPLHVLHTPIFSALMREAETFVGTEGRLETILDANQVRYITDYAHHPAEIAVALEALRNRYPDRRQVVIFYPHTVSRTQAFFDEFVAALEQADVLIVRPIYASARKDGLQLEQMSLSFALAEATGGIYAADESAVIELASTLLQPDDLCITMGAGNNSGLATRIAKRQRSKSC